MNKSKARAEVKHAEALRAAAETTLRMYASRRQTLNKEREEIDARIARLDKDYKEAPDLLREANRLIAEFGREVRMCEQSAVGPPRVREPKTKTEKMLEKRARLIEKLGRIEAELGE